ncbi:glycosyltransferase family 4 protein [Bradyrhizobium cenepequi]|uniref:glycosyltransferase family 4 protein n=1 Tax=Bradyrhizobium cenepequi TaxID=2821403 RepID=UPI001CE2E5F9|nr:glycosyltransferase family 1 protein [Bradyrhizobium cenepequi]
MLYGPMTGISNYSFHIVRGLLKQTSSYQFRGFVGTGWRDITLASLVTAEQGEGGDENSTSFRSGNSFSRRIARLPTQLVVRFSDARPIRLLYRATYRRSFAATVRSERLDFFHAFNFRPPSDPGVPVLPVIYDLSTFRHPEYHPADRVAWLAPLGDIIARAPLVQTISEFSKREIIDLFGYPAEDIFVAPPAAAPVFAPKGEPMTSRDLAPLGLKHGQYFLAVGTLEPRKNIRTLVSAYAQLAPSARAQCPLVVAGGKGWGDLKLPRQLDALRSEGSLRLLGGVPNMQLRSLYEGARLLLMPSLYEGFGMPVVEAMACGTPVAYSSCSAMEEIALTLGRVAPAEDVDAWSGILRQALSCNEHLDPALRRLRINRARTFDWYRSAGLVLDAYRHLGLR